MSAAKRRIKRKIKILVRMDDTRSRMFESSFVQILTGTTPADRYWKTCMTPLGQKLVDMGAFHAALNALNSNRTRRVAAGGRA